MFVIRFNCEILSNMCKDSDYILHSCAYSYYFPRFSIVIRLCFSCYTELYEWLLAI